MQEPEEDAGKSAYSSLKIVILDIIPVSATSSDASKLFKDYLFSLEAIAILKSDKIAEVLDFKKRHDELDQKANTQFFCMIAASCRGTALQLIKEVKMGDGRAALEKLISHYASRGPERMSQLCADFFEIKFNNMTQYRQIFTTILAELKEGQIDIPLIMQRTTFLRALPEEYTSISVEQLRKTTEPMTDLYEILIQHERFLLLRATTNQHSTITNALAATTTETLSRPRCTWHQCKKTGHTEDKCWIKNPKLKKQRPPPREKANAVTATQFQHYSLMVTTLQDLHATCSYTPRWYDNPTCPSEILHQDFMDLFNTEEEMANKIVEERKHVTALQDLHATCSYTPRWYDNPTNPSEILHQEFVDIFNTEDEMANVVVEAGKHAVLQVSTSKSKENTEVVMDSACTAHMMCNEKYFDPNSIIYYKKGDKETPQIKVANSTIIKATGLIGNITIPTMNTDEGSKCIELQLQKVLLVEDLSMNLISTNTLAYSDLIGQQKLLPVILFS